MRTLRSYLLFVAFLLPVFDAGAQQAKADSLNRELAKTTVDTVKVNLLNDIFKAYADFNYVKGLGYGREALELAERCHYDKGICNAHLLLGDYYFEQVNYSEALKHYLKGAVAGENNKFYPELSNIYNKMGIIYSNQKKNEISLKYFLKVAKLAELMHNDRRLAISYNNIGIAYKDLNRYNEAKEYYKKALAEFNKSHFKRGIASVNNGLGIISHSLGDDEAALRYYDTALYNFKLIKDTSMESGIYTNIGELYNDRKEYAKSLAYYLKGMAVAEKYKSNGFKADSYDGLAKLYANMKNYEKAYYFKNRYLALKDSIADEEGMRQVQEMEKRLENEHAEKEIDLLKQKDEIQALKVKSQSEELKKSNIIIFSVAGILIVVLLMSFFIYKAYKQIKKTNRELAEKKQEIQDSINYAKRIQQAMLPDVSLLAKHFPEGGFGLYLPKDVVSGDFYWFSEIGETVFFAAADCTGHGVPGAFMSMIGIDKLNSFIDKKVDKLPQILSLLNISIKHALKQKKDSVSSKDGLDIALCSLDSRTRVLNFAGANRPLWILRNKEIIEYKPTKASIGGYVEDHQEYIAHTIQLERGDKVYIFSDGFADQFGGPEKKKYMSKSFKNTLIRISDLPMPEQELKLQEIFNEWKGDLEQVDDVLVLGFKV
ncbi:MAG: tetratricopeptide repeat protein [Bacteroidia bacterium]